MYGEKNKTIETVAYAVYCFDIDHGGFGLTRDIPPAFLQCTTPEEKHPRASIDLYQQHVERLIAGRGRANYQVACSYLAKIRSLYQKLDETEEWTNYIAWLRKRHSRLSTLKKELAAAGL